MAEKHTTEKGTRADGTCGICCTPCAAGVIGCCPRCSDCGHIHTPQGCTGEPTPSDRWAGVSPRACDCIPIGDLTPATGREIGAGRPKGVSVDQVGFGTYQVTFKIESLGEEMARDIMLRLGQEIADTPSYQAACRVIREFAPRPTPPAVSTPTPATGRAEVNEEGPA